MFTDFFNIPLCFLSITILIGIAYMGKLQKIELAVVGVLLFVLLFEFFAYRYSHFYGVSNLWIYTISMSMVQISTLIIYLRFVPHHLKTILVLSIAIFLILAVTNLLSWQGSDQLNTFTLLPMGILIAIISYVIIRKQVLSADIRSAPLLGFFVGNLTYYTLSIVALSAIPILINLDLTQALNFKHLNDASYSLWSICIATGIVWTKR